MVRFLSAVIADHFVTLLEIIGLVLIIVGVMALAGGSWALIALGVAVLAKSAELDLKSRSRK